ncbi:homoserine kinase type II [Plantibacter sp. VKM Ac-1784]|uniref:Homoserine kinase type II n=1 Tax=Plantibacter elymi (nom. nud.) TaxID=199708 RepID=A0ABY1R7P4_9MICO|nr:phosphotransferase [Plantibacter sp. VKM Ac-1784]SMQ59474.1 homoserine kinase type II [Plantibacter sp. VKM Ac-1784]
MTRVTAPLLEMLWETDDPAEVVAARFGFSDAAAVGEWVAATVGDRWGLDVESVTQVVMSGHNALAWISAPSGSFLAKWSVLPPRFPRLAALTQLTAWLGERGLPVSAPVPSVDGRVQIPIDDRTSMSLQHQISGSLLDVTDRDQVIAAGAALARLHLALGRYPDTEDVRGFADVPKPLATRISGWLESDRSGLLTPSARERLIRLVDNSPTEPLSAQLVHGDFRAANILCAGHDIAAVLDFEEARFDFPIMELAQSAVMLGTRFRDWGPVSPHVHAWLLEGYASERPLTATEADWWNVLVLWFSLVLVPPAEDPTGWGPAANDLLVRIAV